MKLKEIYLSLTKSYIWRILESNKDEASKSTNTHRNQATAQSSEHNKTRNKEQTCCNAQLYGRFKSV